MKNNRPFGLHLMVDAYNCDKKVLNDANALYDFLDKMPDLMGMKKMTKPYLVTTPGNGAHDPGGWSGFVIIEESHISVHTFVGRKFVTIDVYSCKWFDAKKAVESIKKIFKTSDLEVYEEVRGKKYPDKNL